MSCLSMERETSVGKGGRTFVEVLHISQHSGRNPLRGLFTIIEPVLQTLQDQPEPARLDCRSSSAMLLGIRHARPLSDSGRMAPGRTAWRLPVSDECLTGEVFGPLYPNLYAEAA